ncbi:MAG: LacI family DNA-binding transcriptional regulator, partial [Clostridia bacterium]
MATIVDVAQAANVSVATVSRVLNGKSQVREALRERVLSAVEALRYVPNPTARNLRRNESRTI